ncbi:MAG TPA: hypothetical protein VEK73_02405 [Xanthobacteraceae bacterium]|nr:hypothetical protein [Xanthobacteraceae bacterium]
MRTIFIGCAALAGALAVAAPGSQALPRADAGVTGLPAAALVEVATVTRKHRRVRVAVPVPAYPPAPVAAPECPGLYSWNPANPDRGFCDPGFAYHGNVNGCAVDLGYGRWEPCDHTR